MPVTILKKGVLEVKKCRVFIWLSKQKCLLRVYEYTPTDGTSVWSPVIKNFSLNIFNIWS